MSLVREMAMVSVKVTAIWLAALWGVCGTAVAGPLEIRVTLQLPSGSPLYESIANFKAEIEKQTDGAVAITIFPAAQLYKPSEVRGAVSSGAIEMGASLLSEYVQVVPASDIFSLPFMFTSPALLRGATALGSPIRSPIDDAILETTGARVLWWFPSGSSIMVSKGAPVLTPTAIERKKVRVSSVSLGEMVKLCGGIPLESGGDEQYGLYKSGAVDIGMTSMSIVSTRKLWEVMDTLTITDHVQSEFVLIINEKVWQSMPADQQQIVLRAARASEQVFRLKAELQAREAVALAAQHGMRVAEVAESDVKDWKDCATPMLAGFLSQSGTLGAKVMAGYRKVLVDVYRTPPR
jgi:C4-dicarboxylate-binding protein DctP